MALRLLTCLLMCLSTSALAVQGFDVQGSGFNGFGLQGFKRSLSDDIKRLRVQRDSGSGFGLTGSPSRFLDSLQLAQLDVKSAVHAYLQEEGMSASIRLQEVSVRTHRDGTEEFVFSLRAYGVPLCDLHIQAFVVGGKLSYLSGKFPTYEIQGQPASSDWLDPKEFVESYFAPFGTGEEEVVLQSAKQCLLVSASWFEPAWDLVATFAGLPYRMLVNGDVVYKLGKHYFDATGSIKAYRKNPVDAQVGIFEVTGLDNSGRLQGEFFRSQPNGVTPASSTNGTFDFALNTPQFVESTTFVHAHLALEWFQELGYEWSGAKPIVLKIHEIFTIRGQTTVNNAVYIPSATPEIRIGDGDGVSLRNLPLDADVVAHEFGHHVIFEKIIETEGESLVLHEGLSDFFAFQRTDDACLGESICPSGSQACFVPNTCLRSGETTLKATDSSFRSMQAHLQGQLISGMLWDLHAAYSLDKVEVSRIALGAIKFFDSDADFTNFIDALVQSDSALGLNHKCTIIDAAKSRGLAADIDVTHTNSCDGVEIPEKIEPEVSTEKASGSTSVTEEQGTTSATSSTKGGDNGLFGCGTTSSRDQPIGSALLIILLGLPLALRLVPARK